MVKEICKGMQKVCKGLSKLDSNTVKQKKAFENRAKIFGALSKGGDIMAVKLTPQQKMKNDFEKERKKVIKQLDTLEKKCGSKLFRSACNRKLTVDKLKESAQKSIKEKEAELERLKKGKITY
jgi:benzoyl-CoA reductase/2-hydroxyglutaryl-CoA dehydratase subunit BcrC/BadD/HgdB